MSLSSVAEIDYVKQRGFLKRVELLLTLCVDLCGFKLLLKLKFINLGSTELCVILSLQRGRIIRATANWTAVGLWIRAPSSGPFRNLCESNCFGSHRPP